MSYYIYKHTSPNGLVYIGKTTSNPKARWGKEGKGYQTAPRFYAAILLHGWENFTHEIIEETEENSHILSEREAYWIGYYASHLVGYNSQYGGKEVLPRAEGAWCAHNIYKNSNLKTLQITQLYQTGDNYDKAILYRAKWHIEKERNRDHLYEDFSAFYDAYDNVNFHWMSLFKILDEDNDCLKCFLLTGMLPDRFKEPPEEESGYLRSDGKKFKDITAAASSIKVKSKKIQEAVKTGAQVGGFYWSEIK